MLEEEGEDEDDADPSTSSRGSWIMGGGGSQRNLRGSSQRSFRQLKENGAWHAPSCRHASEDACCQPFRYHACLELCGW